MQEWHAGRGALAFLFKLEKVAAAMETVPTADVKSMTVEQLKAEFVAGVRLTRERLARLGAVLVELESRDVKIEGDRTFLSIIRRIGKGTLLADAAVRFGGTPYTLAALGKMPTEEQQRILGYSDAQAREEINRSRKVGQKADTARQNVPSLYEMAKHASVGDVAEMCLKIIRASEQPDAVAAKLLPELQRIKNARRPVAFAR